MLLVWLDGGRMMAQSHLKPPFLSNPPSWLMGNLRTRSWTWVAGARASFSSMVSIWEDISMSDHSKRCMYLHHSYDLVKTRWVRRHVVNSYKIFDKCLHILLFSDNDFWTTATSRWNQVFSNSQSGAYSSEEIWTIRTVTFNSEGTLVHFC